MLSKLTRSSKMDELAEETQNNEQATMDPEGENCEGELEEEEELEDDAEEDEAADDPPSDG